MIRLLGAIVVTMLVSTFITYSLNRFFKKIKFIKYTPAIISFIIMTNRIIVARSNKGEGFENLAAIIIAMICFAATLAGLVTAIYFDFLYFKLRAK